jgi:hypothetical protein
MNYNPIDPTADSIRHYEIQDALMDRDYATNRRYTATPEEHAAFWNAVESRREYVQRTPVAGDIIGYNNKCQPIYA